MIKLAFAWLKINWLPAVIFATFVTYSLLINNAAYDRGYETADNKWKMEIQAAKDEAMDKANEKSKELEKSLSDMRVKNQTLNRKLANEIRKNDVAYQCPVPTIGMQSFNDSIAPNNSTR